jgi:hypothetical protein
VAKKISFFVHGRTISHRIVGSTQERGWPQHLQLGVAGEAEDGDL